MAEFSALEQLLLELINRARLDPAAEAARLGIDLNQGLAAGTISAAEKDPLAPNDNLADAAAVHSSWMLDTDGFSHTGAGGSSPTERISDAGYSLSGNWTTGENIAWIGTTGTVSQTAFTLEAHDNLFRSPGHRENILYGDFLELGNGIEFGVFRSGGINYNAIMVTENFGRHGSGYYITGVAHTDADGDNFYDIGDGRGGVTVSVSSGAGDVTGSAGGYSVNVAGGTYGVTFSGGGLAAPVSVTVAGGAHNVKVDLLGANEIHSSASTTLGAGAVSLTLLGLDNERGTGNAVANTINGNKGGNVLYGLGGNDTLRGNDGNDVLVGGSGRDQMFGGAGNDVFRFTTPGDLGKTSTTRDVIGDFGAADRIDFAAIDARTGGADDKFSFVAAKGSAFTAQGQLRWYHQDVAGTANDKTIVIGNTDANRATAEFHVELKGLVNLNAGDFIL